MAYHENTKTHAAGNAAIYLVGGIAVVALILAWVAYNRSGDDVTTDLQQGSAEVVTETEQAMDAAGEEVAETTTEVVTDAELLAARAEARADLLALRAELAAESNYAEVADQVAETRAELADLYVEASTAAQADWNALENDFMTVENSIRLESAEALNELDQLISDLERDVRTTEE